MARAITATHLYEWDHCRYWPYLELHEDPRKKDPLSEFQEYLFDQGHALEKLVYLDLHVEPLAYALWDLEAGFRETLALMRRGVPLIAQGVLIHEDLRGIPDIVERVPGASALGDYHYRPVEIKMGHSLKKVYEYQLAFYAHLLERIQGCLPASAAVYLWDLRKEEFQLAGAMEPFYDILEHLRADRDRRETPHVHIFSGCDQCVWRSRCRAEALASDDVSLLAGLTHEVKRHLLARGVRTVQDLASMSERALDDVNGVGAKMAARLLQQAQALRSGTPLVFAPPSLPTAAADMYFDIEREPSIELTYLFGLLLPSGEYRSFLAETAGEEMEIWRRFLAFMKEALQRAPGTVVYHYHHFERTWVDKLWEAYGGDQEAYEILRSRMVDLQPLFRDSVAMPTLSYSLKDLAKWLGFRWRNTKSNAAMSMLWYRLWLDTTDRQYLDSILVYNEDDVRATKVLKEWLARQHPDHPVAPLPPPPRRGGFPFNRRRRAK